MTNDDPNRYEPKPESDVFGKLTLAPLFVRGGGVVVLSGELR